MNCFRTGKLTFVLLLLGLVAAQALPALATAAPPAPTVFSSGKFKLPMTFTFGPDWFVEHDYAQLVTLSLKEEALRIAFNIVNDAQLFDPTDGHRVPFPQDFAAWIKADHDFVAGEQRRVTVAGREGLQIDGTPNWPPRAVSKRFLAVNGSVTWNIVNSPEKWRFIWLGDVNGQRVLILMIAPADRFEAAMEKARVILDRVMLGRPAAAPAPTAVASAAVQPTAGPATAPAPTTFSPEKFLLPMTFTFGSDWYVEDNYPELVTISRKQGDSGVAFNIVDHASLYDPAGGGKIPFPQDFVTWLKKDPDFAGVTTQRVMVAGVQGLQIDATPVWRSTTAKIKRFLAVNARVTWNLVTEPEKWRFIMLDNVNGQRVLILMIASPHKFDAAMQKAHQILDNVKIGRPTSVTSRH